MENNYTFNVYSQNAILGISDALNSYSDNFCAPTIVCIGSDLVLGDSLGPLVGTILSRKSLSAYVYGTLNTPVTAKEISYIKDMISSVHGNSLIIAVDAAVGEPDSVGLIKINKGGLMPGLGVNKDLGKIGDVSIIGVVAEKDFNNYSLFNTTRLGLVYRLAETISAGIYDYISRINNLRESCV